MTEEIPAYSKYASLYDQSLHWNGYRRGIRHFWRRVFSHLPPPQMILDVGCGSGLMTGILLREYPGAAVVGFDLNQAMLEIFRRRIKKWPPAWRQQIKLECCNLFDFQSEQKFNLIVIGGVLEYVDATKALRRLRAFLAPGGVLVNLAVKPNRFTRHIIGPMFDFKPRSVRENQQAFHRAGFSDVRTSYFSPVEFPASFLKLAFWSGGC